MRLFRDKRRWRARLELGGNHSSLLDGVALTIVPLLLLWAYSFPITTRRALTLAYLDPTPLAMITSHFIHLSHGHLIANLGVYGLVVPLAAFCCRSAGSRRAFYLTGVTFVIVFPFVLSALNLLWPRPRIGLGFSGILMAFTGFLPITLYWYAENTLGYRVRWSQLPFAFVLGCCLVLGQLIGNAGWRPKSLAGVSLLSLTVGGVLLYTTEYVSGVKRIATQVRTAPQSVFQYEWPLTTPGSEFVVAGCLIFTSLVALAVQPRAATSASIPNYYSHVLGYCFGFIVPYCYYSVNTAEFWPTN